MGPPPESGAGDARAGVRIRAGQEVTGRVTGSARNGPRKVVPRAGGSLRIGLVRLFDQGQDAGRDDVWPAVVNVNVAAAVERQARADILGADLAASNLLAGGSGIGAAISSDTQIGSRCVKRSLDNEGAIA